MTDYRLPTMPTPASMLPAKLRRAAERIHTDGVGHPGTQAALNARAKTILDGLMAGGEVAFLESRVARIWLEEAPKWDPFSRRQAAAIRSILAHPETGWRVAFGLWNVVDAAHRRDVVNELVQRLSDQIQENPRFAAKRLPGWLPTGPVQMRDVLLDPDSAILRWAQEKKIPLWQIHAAIRSSVATGPVCGSVAALIRNGSKEWWNLSTPEQARGWAESRKSRVFILAVADRLLIEAGGSAANPGHITRNTASDALRLWVLQHLGEPHTHPANWDNHMSARSRQVFEWLMLREEFDRVLAEFRRNATEWERANYWTSQISWLRDATTLTSTDGVAICLMILDRGSGPRLVVEFGTSGNACYVYGIESPDPRPLRAMKNRRDWHSRDYKQQGRQLQLGGGSYRYWSKFNHSYGWTKRFDAELFGTIHSVQTTARPPWLIGRRS